MRALTRLLTVTLAASVAFSQCAGAFCGFYVATTDTKLINKASRVVLAHDGDTTLVTMASDVAGDPKEFGLVVPVPTVIQREQVKVVPAATVQHLADYTKPRLVRYDDPDPCYVPPPISAIPVPAMAAGRSPIVEQRTSVRIEAQYLVEEYDIVVLTATQPADLISYLNSNGYRIPPGAEPVVGSYLRQGMHFFLAKVNLAKMRDSTSGTLRPIQVTYHSAKFMLPIRLGTVNADGPQDMIVLALTRKGRVETTNYRTVKVPTGQPVPMFVEARFGEFYDTMFTRQVAANPGTTFLEYAWAMGSCDPCSSPPLQQQELLTLGAGWMAGNGDPGFVTRLHIRYDRDRFPEDLTLQETPDTEAFQARYEMHRPFVGEAACPNGEAYKASIPARNAEVAQSLQALTGWPPETIRSRMIETGQKLP